eukprot:4622768-Alexandrium_andersonii.AAC.1
MHAREAARPAACGLGWGARVVAVLKEDLAGGARLGFGQGASTLVEGRLVAPRRRLAHVLLELGQEVGFVLPEPLSKEAGHVDCEFGRPGCRPPVRRVD